MLYASIKLTASLVGQIEGVEIPEKRRVRLHFAFGPRGSTVSGRQYFAATTPLLALATSPA